ncbi:MAG TPA: hypothetical protein VLW85_10065 [Myxococcales bacterium]|nr:hypothetical protein [Myxococcales bacterium]
MRFGFRTRLVALALAPAVFASVATQGLLLLRCGESMRMSCCCPKDDPPAAPRLSPDASRCCAEVQLPASQVATHSEPAALHAPVMVAAVAVAALPPKSLDVRPPARAPHPPGGPPIVLAHCSLLI